MLGINIFEHFAILKMGSVLCFLPRERVTGCAREEGKGEACPDARVATQALTNPPSVNLGPQAETPGVLRKPCALKRKRGCWQQPALACHLVCYQPNIYNRNQK